MSAILADIEGRPAVRERHPDLITRDEAAALLFCSASKLAHGWGPPPLPHFKRPVMYSRKSIERWLEEQAGGAECHSTNATTQQSGGPSSSTAAKSSVAQRIRQIEKQRRQRLAASGSRSSKPKALVVVLPE